MSKVKKKEIGSALYKKALGYSLEEVVEEYVIDKEDNERLILNKKKITKKNVPPDVVAVKALLQLYKNDKISNYNKMSDDELKTEKLRLLNDLKTLQKGEDNGTRKNKNKNKV